MYSDLLKSDFKEWAQSYDLSSGVTRMPRKEEAFMLLHPVVGSVLTPVKVEADTTNYTGVVVRSIVPYKALFQMSTNFPLGCFILSNHINAMLLAAAKVGPIDHSVEVISFQRPGRENEFLRDMENNAGCELRLYVKW